MGVDGSVLSGMRVGPAVVMSVVPRAVVRGRVSLRVVLRLRGSWASVGHSGPRGRSPGEESCWRPGFSSMVEDFLEAQGVLVSVEWGPGGRHLMLGGCMLETGVGLVYFLLDFIGAGLGVQK